MQLLTGARILLAVRDRAATSFESLCRELACDTSTDQMILGDKLEQLRELGLIAFTGPAERCAGIEIAKRWTQIQVALGGQSLRLQDIADLDMGTAMVVRPFFKPPHSESKLDVFVLMPFSEELRPIYTNHIKPVAERLGLQSRRGDDFFAPREVMADIWAAINQARIVVADCTERNANVFYEIGLAHVVNKPVVLITQKEEDVPFDLRHLRYVKYASDQPGLKELEAKLEQAFREELGMEARGAVL